MKRENLVFSFANEIINFSHEELVSKLTARFENEDGFDQGGLRAELFCKVSQELFSPEKGLFKLTPNENNVEINPLSILVPNHLMLFQFAGIVLGKVKILIYSYARQFGKKFQLL